MKTNAVRLLERLGIACGERRGRALAPAGYVRGTATVAAIARAKA